MGDEPDRILDALESALLILGPDGATQTSNRAARALGLDDDKSFGLGTLRTLAARARRAKRGRVTTLDLVLGPGRSTIAARVRATPLPDDRVVVEIIDDSPAHRIDQVRRDFVANVSHELKTPVGALRLLAEALSEAITLDDAPAVRRFSDRIDHEANRLARLINELLELSRLQAAGPVAEPQAIPASRIITEVLDRSRITAGAKQMTFDVRGADDLVVHGDEPLLVTALGNLVDNAISYSPPGTTITISCSEDEKTVALAVQDHGMGVAAEDRDRIFERFYRADPARSRETGGTGLGLALVKHIAQNHGGQVEVTSKPGQGSTFSLRLPKEAR